MTYQYTTQPQIRAAFWQEIELSGAASAGPHDITEYVVSAGAVRTRRATQNDYPAEVRTAFVDYVDALQKSGAISEALAARVTL